MHASTRCMSRWPRAQSASANIGDGPGCDARSPPLRRRRTGAGLPGGLRERRRENRHTLSTSSPRRAETTEAASKILVAPGSHPSSVFLSLSHTHNRTQIVSPERSRLTNTIPKPTCSQALGLFVSSFSVRVCLIEGTKSKRRNVGELNACHEPLLTDSIINNHKERCQPPRPSFAPGRHNNSSDLSQSHPLRTNLLLLVSSFLISAS